MNLDARSSSLDVRPADEGSPPTLPVVRPGHRLGPLIMVVPLDGPVAGRVYAAAFAVAALVVLAVAAKLTPDPHGAGTHQQLGLPPCGFMVMSGLPCPTCGMTTAFSLTVRGRVVAALEAQAGGFALALATLATGVLGVFALLTGRKVVLNWYRINPTGVIWLATLGFLLAWGAKIAYGLATGRLPLR